MRRAAIRAVLFVLLGWLCASGVAYAQDEEEEVVVFRRYIIGNALDVERPTQGLLVLQGGGDDADENYIRMGKLGGGGDFVVIRASGDDDYNRYIYDLCNCDSVETIVFAERYPSCGNTGNPAVYTQSSLWGDSNEQFRPRRRTAGHSNLS